MENTQEFGRFRKILFPIYNYELRKVLPLFFLFMLISGSYFLLRSLKDMFLISYTGQAETLYFLKVYGVTPFMIVLTLVYSTFAKYHRDTRFYIMIGYFLAIISACYFVFIPNIETLKLDGFATMLDAKIPGMKPLWESIRFWPCSLVYLHAEAWGSFALGVLFWTFCNDIISFKQSKRIYAYLSMGAALGTGIAGFIVKDFIKADFNSGIGVVIGIITAILIIYYFFARDVKRNPEFYQIDVAAPKKAKIKMSMGESFKFLAKSKHLALIATLVLCYGAFMSLFESVHKAQVGKLTAFLEKDAAQAALSLIYGYQGISNAALSILFVFMSGWFAKRGWKFTAITTPIVALFCTGLFFLFLFAGDIIPKLFGNGESIAVVDMLWIAVMFGVANAVFIKAAKYVLFDPTCNQAYIPLDEDSKVRGKAAVDGVGSRLGKSFGSLLISAPLIGLVGIFGSIDNAKIFICALIVIFLLLWIRAVGKLSTLLKKDEEEKK